MRRLAALVTGATGFVGQHVVHHLCDAGWAVNAVVRAGSSRASQRHVDAQVSVHEYDGTIASMMGIVNKVRPSVSFHLAARVCPDHTLDDIAPLFESNLLLGTQLAEALSQSKGAALVNTGTSWQHFNGHAYSPVNLYAASKQAFEALLQYYVEARDLRVITLKLFDTYGPGDTRAKIVNLLARHAANGESLAMSEGNQLIDLVHVDDVARAYLAAADRIASHSCPEHERFAVSSGEPIRLRDLVRRIEAYLGRPLPVLWGERPCRSREVLCPWGGPRLPGWTPQISLESGLKSLFRQQPNESGGGATTAAEGVRLNARR